MDRSPDTPQPWTPTILVSRLVQRPTPPERVHGSVERPAGAPPAAEVRWVQDLILPEIPVGRSQQPGRGRDAFYLPRDEGIFEPVLPSVCRGREQHGKRPSVVGVDLPATIVVDEGHRLPRLFASLEAPVEGTRIRRQDDAVRSDPGGQLFPERRVHGNA